MYEKRYNFSVEYFTCFNLKMTSTIIKLPKPRKIGQSSLEELLLKRRSRRRYRNTTMGFDQLSQLLWAGQGINNSREGLRTAPSAGALYPLELYCITGGIDKLDAGIYKHQVKGHGLKTVASGDFRKQLADIALEQEWLQQANVIIIFSAVKWRTQRKYGRDSQRYILIEVGHIAQNILLQAESLGLSAAVIGAFYPAQIRRLLKLPKSETPLYILSVGSK